MLQQGKQGRVGARKGFQCNSVKVVLVANSNRYEVDSNTFFLSCKALYPLKILPCPNLTFFFTHIRICGLCYYHQVFQAVHLLKSQDKRNLIVFTLQWRFVKLDTIQPVLFLRNRKLRGCSNCVGQM
jgi:hypothetical protein